MSFCITVATCIHVHDTHFPQNCNTDGELRQLLQDCRMAPSHPAPKGYRTLDVINMLLGKNYVDTAALFTQLQQLPSTIPTPDTDLPLIPDTIDRDLKEYIEGLVKRVKVTLHLHVKEASTKAVHSPFFCVLASILSEKMNRACYVDFEMVVCESGRAGKDFSGVSMENEEEPDEEEPDQSSSVVALLTVDESAVRVRNECGKAACLLLTYPTCTCFLLTHPTCTCFPLTHPTGRNISRGSTNNTQGKAAIMLPAYFKCIH